MTHSSRRSLTGAVLSAAALGLLSAPAMAQDFATDGTFQGSLCVGVDCSFNENFGFDTIRMKENNLRLNFEDTSVSASFPSRDWTIVANDSANGGANYLAFQDDDTGRLVFRVDAAAPANSLRVDSNGDVGVNVDNPVVELHVRDGDSPTLRLEQDGSSGFAAQTFDIAANETNFFVRDVTNGSQLPFKIQPGADDNSLVVSDNNDIGMGTLNPAAALHVVRNTGAFASLLELQNNGPVAIILDNDDATNPVEWRMGVIPGTTDLVLVTPDAAGDEFKLSTGGNVTITGNYFTAAGQLNVPDYVFADDYELRPLSEVRAFIDANSHLPDVPSAAEIAGQGLDMTAMQMTLLQKVEELTLYTLAQDTTIQSLQAEVAALRD